MRSISRVLVIACLLLAFQSEAWALDNASLAGDALSLVAVTPDNLWVGTASPLAFNLSFSTTNYANCSLIVNGTVQTSQEFAAGTNSFSFSAADGSYSWSVNCLDAASNLNTSPRNLFVDSVAPQVQLSVPAISLADVAIAVNATDSSELACSLTVDAASITYQTYQTVQMPFGTHTVMANCTDQAGNPASAQAVVIVVGGNLILPALINPGTTASITVNATSGANVTITISGLAGYTQSFALNSTTSFSYRAPGLAGAYSVNYTVSYADVVALGITSFSIPNTLSLAIVSDTSDAPLVGVLYQLSANVSGGIPPYTFQWSSSYGNSPTTQNFPMTYPHAGLYSFNVSVRDLAGNVQSASRSYQANFRVTVQVLNQSDTVLNNSRVEWDSAGQNLNSSGLAVFYLSAGEHQLYVSSPGYKSQHNATNISSHANFTIRLHTQDTSAPEIQLLSPASGIVSGGSQLFTFKATDISSLSCRLVMTGSESNFTDWKSCISGVQNSFTASFPDGTYNWKVECKDEFDNLAASDVRSMVFQTRQITTVLSTKSAASDSLNQSVINYSEFEDAIRTFRSYPAEISQIAQMIGIDLSESEASLREFRLNNQTSLSSLRQGFPASLELVETKHHEQTADEYIRNNEKAITALNISWLTSRLSSAKSKARIESTFRTVRFSMLDGASEYYTIVEKSVLYNGAAQVLEFIPKVSLDEFHPGQSHSLISQQPILVDFNGSMNITYYIEGRVLPNSTITILLPQKSSGITGMLVVRMDSREGRLTAFAFSGVLLLIFTLAIMVRSSMRKTPLTQSIKTIGSELDMGELEAAAHNYAQAKREYNMLPEKEQNKVYSKLAAVGYRINVKALSRLLDKAEAEIKAGNVEPARQMYQEIERALADLPRTYHSGLAGRKKQLGILLQSKHI